MVMFSKFDERKTKENKYFGIYILVDCMCIYKKFYIFCAVSHSEACVREIM